MFVGVTRLARGCTMVLSGLLMTFCGSVFAGTVILKNGDRLTGAIDSIAGGRVLLETKNAGRVTILVKAVESVTSTAVFHVRLRQGGSLVGRFAVEDSVQRLLSEDEVLHPLKLSDVANAARRGDQLAALVSGWNTRADLSASVSSGNSDTESVNLLVHSRLNLDWTAHDWMLLLNREEADGVRSKEQIDFDYGYKRFFSNRWFALGNAEYYRDELKDIDLRITVGGGIGYQVWQDSFGALSLGVGVSAVFDEIGTKARENPAWRWEMDYNRFFWSKQFEIFHRNSLLVIPDGGRGEVIEASTGVRLAITDRLNTHMRVDHRIDTQPPEDADRTDVTYNLGVGFKF